MISSFLRGFWRQGGWLRAQDNEEEKVLRLRRDKLGFAQDDEKKA
jgi:hypothetical protein